MPQLLEHAPQARVEILPHLYQQPRVYSYREIDVYREEVLKVPREECLFAVLGHLRESKRIEVYAGKNCSGGESPTKRKPT